VKSGKGGGSKDPCPRYSFNAMKGGGGRRVGGGTIVSNFSILPGMGSILAELNFTEKNGNNSES